jgi:hypothetical protein
MKNVLAVAMMLLAGPVLADCVSCGPGGDCYTTSAGFSGNCECRIRSVNGASSCRPLGVCDPNDANSCKTGEEGGGFPIMISTRFVTGLAEVNPLLAAAAWAGVDGANETSKDRAEVKGTMGQDGRSYTYRADVRRLPKGSVSLIIEVQEDGAPGVQRFEGTLTRLGRSGRFVEAGPKGRAPVYSWEAR